MENEWKSYSLGEICSYSKERINIQDVTNKNYISTENMFPDKGGITEAATLPNVKSVSRYEKGDTLISNIRPYFKKIWFSNKIGGASNDVLVIKGKSEKVFNKYLYYFLTQDKFFDYVMGTSKGTKMPRGDKDAILKYDIKLPPLDEQKAIAKVLSDLDEKIGVNNKINKKLEEMAQAIFKQWFVDFEFPNEEGKPYKSSGGEMVESELGMIPKGWYSKSLLDIADYLNGLAMQKFRPGDDEKGIPVLKIKELRQGKTDENSDLCSLNIDPKYIIHDGDVIFSWSGSLLVDFWCSGKCGLNQHLFKVTSSKFEKWFYYLWTKYHLDKFIRIAKDKATTMGHIKRADLSNSIVLVPNEVIMNKANLILNPIIEKIIQARIEERKLSQLRDTVLPKLMSGEIRVALEN